MLTRPAFRQGCFSGFGLNPPLTSLSLGVILLTVVALPATARPRSVFQHNTFVQPVQPSLPYVYGSPIPSPVPLRQPTTQPYSSPYGSYDYGFSGTPTRGVIRNSTLINPTVIDSRITDSVLINPTIVNTPRRGIQRSRIYYGSPNVQINIGL
jgi:hypothetical protein